MTEANHEQDDQERPEGEEFQGAEVPEPRDPDADPNEMGESDENDGTPGAVDGS